MFDLHNLDDLMPDASTGEQACKASGRQGGLALFPLSALQIADDMFRKSNFPYMSASICIENSVFHTRPTPETT